ncbi:hypothetical protein G3M48_007069 [Beauveria asiatica]|uniref:Uncharacterized protein n=1 Tax=Beauveria asiatica TaxID=1069075 RepID=A0AAW0RNU1_9HYPO
MNRGLFNVFNLFQEAEARMVAEFIDAGHISLANTTPNDLHPLHQLFLDTRELLQQVYQCYSYPFALETLKSNRASLHRQLLFFKGVCDKPRNETLKMILRNGFLYHANLLALRFATLEESDNVEIVELLITLNILHLWHVPAHTDTEAKMLETNDDAEDSSTVGAPTEGDSNLETALKVELADADRQIKTIQDAKKDLERKLAVLKETESAVLQARDAMTQTQNAIAKRDIALMESPVSFSAESC